MTSIKLYFTHKCTYRIYQDTNTNEVITIIHTHTHNKYTHTKCDIQKKNTKLSFCSETTSQNQHIIELISTGQTQHQTVQQKTSLLVIRPFTSDNIMLTEHSTVLLHTHARIHARSHTVLSIFYLTTKTEVAWGAVSVFH